MSSSNQPQPKNVLILGASRGIGLGMVEKTVSVQGLTINVLVALD